jgi:hypothetical protein
MTIPATSKLGDQQPRKRGYRNFYSRRNYIHRKTKAITGNALRLQLDSRKHLNAKNCLQMEMNDNNIIRLNGTGFRVNLFTESRCFDWRLKLSSPIT